MSATSDRIAAIERALAHPLYYDGDMGADIRWLVEQLRAYQGLDPATETIVPEQRKQVLPNGAKWVE